MTKKPIATRKCSVCGKPLLKGDKKKQGRKSHLRCPKPPNVVIEKCCATCKRSLVGLATIKNKNGLLVHANCPKVKKAIYENSKFDKFKEHRERAKHFGVPGQGKDGLTQAQWNAILKKYGRKCLACGATGVELHIDHVIPLSKGGGNVKENIQPLCGPCNIKKFTDSTDYRIDYK